MQSHRYTIEELKKLQKEIVILVDSREQKNSHILDYFQRHHISYQVTALQFGDYSFYIPASSTKDGTDIYFHRDIVIERKATLEELSGNLAQNRERFEKELLRAAADGSRVYLMIENPGGYSEIIAHRYKTEFTPTAYMASMKAFEARHDVHVQFIDRRYSGYYILTTFQYFLRERLK